MSQVQGQQNLQHLEGLFNKRNPNTRFSTQSRIQQYNQSIVKEIMNGDTVLNKSDQNSEQQVNRFDQQKRKKHLLKAKRQKQALQQQLSYVNRSIDSIQKYSYLKAQVQQSNNLNKSRTKSPEELRQQKKKDIQFKRQMVLQKQKLDSMKKAQEQRKLQKEKQNKQLEKKIQQQEKAKRKKQIYDNMMKMKQRMEHRQEQNKNANQKLKQIIRKKQLFQKFQESYQQKQMSILEQRKKKLAEIRNFHKPIDMKEIKQHQKRITQIMKEKQDIRQRQKKIDQSNLRYKIPYQSSYYLNVSRRSQSVDLNNSKLKIDKIKQFSQHVRENFVPQLDEKKKRQIQQFMQKQLENQKKKEQRQIQLKEAGKKKGNQYLEQVKKLPKKRSQSKTTQERASLTARPAYKNYITHSNADANQTQKTWIKILGKKELNQKQKARLLQYESQKVEQILKRKEQQARLLKKNNEQDIDQEYYHMIKAKLDLLAKH